MHLPGAAIIVSPGKVILSAEDGDYWRLLPPGEHEVDLPRLSPYSIAGDRIPCEIRERLLHRDNPLRWLGPAQCDIAGRAMQFPPGFVTPLPILPNSSLVSSGEIGDRGELAIVSQLDERRPAGGGRSWQ